MALARRRLAERRKLVLGLVVCAFLLGTLIAFKIGSGGLQKRQHYAGIATASALVDSSSSQLADLNNPQQQQNGIDLISLADRAQLLGTVMAQQPITGRIAKLAGIPAQLLIATQPQSAPVGTVVPGQAVTGATVQRAGPNAVTMNVSVVTQGQVQLPVIEVNTQAPTAALAAKVATSAFTALGTEVHKVGVEDRVPGSDQVVIRPLGPAVAARITKGPTLTDGLLAGLILLLAGCIAIATFPSKRAAQDEQSDPQVIDTPVGLVASWAGLKHQKRVMLSQHTVPSARLTELDIPGEAVEELPDEDAEQAAAAGGQADGRGRPGRFKRNGAKR